MFFGVRLRLPHQLSIWGKQRCVMLCKLILVCATSSGWLFPYLFKRMKRCQRQQAWWGHAQAKMTCPWLTNRDDCFLIARNKAESCESACWSSWFIVHHSSVICVIYSVILFEWHLCWFPIIGTAWNPRGLNKGKAPGCKTSSKYQYNDCHLK